MVRKFLFRFNNLLKFIIYMDKFNQQEINQATNVKKTFKFLVSNYDEEYQKKWLWWCI